MSLSDPSLIRGRVPMLSDAWEALRVGDARAIGVVIAVLVALLVTAVMTWGPVALALTALALVPVIMVVLILITVGK